jgi:hypothetical protein
VANQSIYLTSLTSPTGAYTKYNYTLATTYYGPASSRDYERVNERYDQTSSGVTPNYNDETFSYTYSNMLWRYITNTIYPLNSSATASNYCLLGDIKEITNLNNNFRMTSSQVYQNTGSVKQTQTDIVSIDSYNNT